MFKHCAGAKTADGTTFKNVTVAVRRQHTPWRFSHTIMLEVAGNGPGDGGAIVIVRSLKLF